MADTIHADKLCALTGLTDRRHRQLAKAGYFPPPSMSEYQLAPTIKGMFRYYRDGSANSNEQLTAEKIRETKARANLLEREDSVAKRESIDAEKVLETWSAVFVALRQAVWNCDAPEAHRRRWLAEIQGINREDYFNTAKPIESDVA